jgi:hypothetical protein
MSSAHSLFSLEYVIGIVTIFIKKALRIEHSRLVLRSRPLYGYLVHDISSGLVQRANYCCGFTARFCCCCPNTLDYYVHLHFVLHWISHQKVRQSYVLENKAGQSFGGLVLLPIRHTRDDRAWEEQSLVLLD